MIRWMLTGFAVTGFALGIMGVPLDVVAALCVVLIVGFVVGVAAARRELDRLTAHLDDERGGDYTYDQTDAGYYAALDDVRTSARLVRLPAYDRRKREELHA